MQLLCQVELKHVDVPECKVLTHEYVFFLL